MESKDAASAIQRAYSVVEDALGLAHELSHHETRPELHLVAREDQRSDGTAEEVRRAAARLDRAEGLVNEALDEIRDVSRGMKELVASDEIPDRIRKKMPSESDMEQALEVGTAANRNEEALNAASRRADEIRARRAEE